MGRSGFTGLSIREEEYAKMRRKWDRLFGVNYELTFTQWYTFVVTATLDKVRVMKKVFPHLGIQAKIKHGVIIDDVKNNKVIKVVMADDGEIICSDNSEDAEQYIRFACLSPDFQP